MRRDFLRTLGAGAALLTMFPSGNQNRTESRTDAPKMAPFLRVIKCQNSSKIRVTKMSPQMSNLMIDGSTKRQIFAEK